MEYKLLIISATDIGQLRYFEDLLECGWKIVRSDAAQTFVVYILEKENGYLK